MPAARVVVVPMRYSHATRWFITLGAGGALLLGACTDSGDPGDANTDTTTTATASPTATESTNGGSGTVTATPTDAPTKIATVETSPTPEDGTPITSRPPELEATSASASIPAGLGTYCWTPPEGSGQPGLCADAIGIITTADPLTASPGTEVVLEASEADALGSATAVNVQVWPRDELGDPISSGDWGVAWNPGAAQATVIEGTLADDTITFTAPDEASAYIVGLFVTFENGDAMYGLQLEVQ